MLLYIKEGWNRKQQQICTGKLLKKKFKSFLFSKNRSEADMFKINTVFTRIRSLIFRKGMLYRLSKLQLCYLHPKRKQYAATHLNSWGSGILQVTFVRLGDIVCCRSIHAISHFLGLFFTNVKVGGYPHPNSLLF